MANPPIVPAFVNNNVRPFEPQPPGRWLRRLHVYLVNEDNMVCTVLTSIQNSLGIPKSVSLNFLVGLLMIVLMFATTSFRRIVCTLLTVCYPIYSCCTVLTGKVVVTDDMLVKWLLFWTIYGMFEFAESVASFLPFYWLGKTLFLLALCLPPIDLCDSWVREWLNPLIYLSQKKFDRQVFLDTHPFLLKSMNLEKGCFKYYDEFVLKNELTKVETKQILKSMLKDTPLNVPLPVGGIVAVSLFPISYPFFS